MKKFLLTLIAVLSFSFTTFGQDTIWLYNVATYESITFEAGYTFDEVDSLIMTSRVAFIDDADEMLWYYFEYLGIKSDFWHDAVQRYVDWPEEAEAADALGEYYHPQSMIFVPNSDYVNAIAFDWSSGEIKIAIFCEDGLWTTTDSLSDEWARFIDSTFAEIIDNASEDEP